MIEQIIEKFEKKYRPSVLAAYPEYRESHNILLNDMQDFIRTEFSSYNKQLLDGIDHEWRVELAEIIRLDNYEQSSTTLQERIIDLINTK